MNLKRGLKSAFDSLINGLAVFAGGLLVLTMLCVCLDVIMRYFLKKPQVWVSELTEYALLYMTFTGTAWVLKQRGHVQVDILLTLLSPKTRNYLEVISQVIGLLVCSVLTYYGITVAWDNYIRGVYNPTILEFPKWPLLAVIPFGTFLLMIQFIRNLWAVVNSLREE